MLYQLSHFRSNVATTDQGGAESQIRTGDTAIFSRVLYQLSYLGPMANQAWPPVGGGRIARTATALQRADEPSWLRPGGVRCFGIRPAPDSATSSANRFWRVSSRLALTTHHVACVR